jgi:hypothetical protein
MKPVRYISWKVLLTLVKGVVVIVIIW